MHVSFFRPGLPSPHSSVGKSSAQNAGDPSLIPELGRSPGEGSGNLLQYSCLKEAHGQRSLAGLQFTGSQESDRTWRPNHPFTLTLFFLLWNLHLPPRAYICPLIFLLFTYHFYWKCLCQGQVAFRHQQARAGFTTDHVSPGSGTKSPNGLWELV